ncbi:hypothetical protein MAR_003623, partial [Mya arenaria]
MTERKQNWTLRELEELAAGVNSVGGNGRTIDEMSKKWKDLKSRTKKKEQGRLKALRSSGLGTIPQTLILTELEERFLGVANEDEVEVAAKENCPSAAAYINCAESSSDTVKNVRCSSGPSSTGKRKREYY